jgi:hypothetical protein
LGCLFGFENGVQEDDYLVVYLVVYLAVLKAEFYPNSEIDSSWKFASGRRKCFFGSLLGCLFGFENGVQQDDYLVVYLVVYLAVLKAEFYPNSEIDSSWNVVSQNVSKHVLFGCLSALAIEVIVKQCFLIRILLLLHQEKAFFKVIFPNKMSKSKTFFFGLLQQRSIVR